MRALRTALGTPRFVASRFYTKVLVASLLVALVPLAVLAMFDYVATKRVLETSADRALLAAASQTAVRLDSYVTADLGVINAEAHVPAFAEYLERREDGREDSKAEGQVLDVLQALTHSDAVFISSVALLDLKGRNVLDTDASGTGRDESNRDYFRVALESGLAYASPVEFAPRDGKAYLYFSSTVSTAAGVPVGVLRARYSAAILQQLIVQDSGLVGPQSHPILLDENGLCLADGLSSPGASSNLLNHLVMPLDRDRATDLAAARRLPRQGADAPLASSTGLSQIYSRGNSRQPYLTVERPAPGSGPYAAAVSLMKMQPWTVAFLEPKEMLLAPARVQARNTILLAAIFALLVAIAAVGAARIVTGPIADLTVIARQVTEGNFYATAKIESNDEIGVLAEAFNSMTKQLQASIVSLEQRVAERTQQLQLAKDAAERARQAAEIANRAKSVFLANMSHEVRTPLNAVLGFSQLMKNSPGVTEEQKKNLEIITRSGEHLLHLINNVLEVSKIESGRVEIEESNVDLYQLAEEMKSLMYVQAAEKELSFTLEQSRDLPRYVAVDGGKLRQVLINLIANAIKYTRSGGVVLRAKVTQQESAERVRLRFEVEDTGSGISEEDRERIFVPFVQLGNQPHAETGTGLGLAICRQYVELMGGRIGVESEHGKGSVFHFEIPVTVRPAAAIRVEPQHGRAIGLAEGQPRYRLLIAEDHSENRLLLRSLFDPLGFDLREAINGQEAVDLFAQWRPDLILMDIRMPVMDGLEATRQIKATEAGAKTRIVAVTAHALEEERSEILAAGCDDIIRKPFREAEVFESLARLGIRFQYEDENAPTEKQKRTLDEQTLRQLPPELLEDLRTAVELLSRKRGMEVIARIREKNVPLGDELRAMVDEFRHKELLQVLDRLGEEGRK